MRATWRALAVWPYEPRPQSSSSFRTTWDGSLAKLEGEIDRIAGDDVVIGIVTDPSEISFSGVLRNRGRVSHPGAEVSFDRPGFGRLVFGGRAGSDRHARQRWPAAPGRTDGWSGADRAPTDQRGGARDPRGGTP